MRIPLVDLVAQYATLRPELEPAIAKVLESAAFVGGPEVAAFESEYAAYCGVANAVGVANGTDALHLAVRALGIGPGDEVVTVPNTFIATTEAIELAGARPVFVDVDPDTWLMDPERLEAAITERTRAVIPVHLYGQAVDMTPVLEVARRRGLRVIEDAAQAHGAKDRGRRAGSMGDVGCFSFYPGKNLGAYGDGGAVVTDDAELADRVRRLANHGRIDKYLHGESGVNSRLDGIQAAVLRIKLRHLDAWNEARRGIAAAYTRLLADVPGVVTPAVRDGAEHVFHLYVVQVPDRDGLLAHLAENGVGAAIHYQRPLHLQPAYEAMGIEKGAFPVAEALSERILSLPIYAELGEERAARVAELVAGYARSRGWSEE